MLCILAVDVGFWRLCRSVPEFRELHYTPKFKPITHICGEIARECRATFRHSSVSPNKLLFGLPPEMPCCHEYTPLAWHEDRCILTYPDLKAATYRFANSRPSLGCPRRRDGARAGQELGGWLT